MDRQQKLGFVPQRELVYNKHLPYSEALDDESKLQLEEIKKNLSHAVQMRDIIVGAYTWSRKLNNYIHLYGFKFSKEDHVLFIQLLYELVTIPDLNGALLQKFTQHLGFLLKKVELLTPEDLQLEWRPLYKVLDKVMYGPGDNYALTLYPATLEKNLIYLVRVARMYFPLSATAEMLEEWRPLLCPFDQECYNAFHYMELFFPTHLPEEHYDKGFKLWLTELMGFWDVAHNSPAWEMHIFSLITRLARESPGCVAWDEYIPKIFNRFLRSFNLPVGTSSIQVARTNDNNFDVNTTSSFIANMLGHVTNTQHHIDSLFNAFESYYHPSNVGKWSGRLSRFLFRLSANVVNRVWRERYKKPSWELSIPDSVKLTDDQITTFVQSMKPVALLAMFGRQGSHDVISTVRQLSLLRPEIINPPLLEYIYPALESVMESHRLIACLSSVVSVYKSMLGNSQWYPEGRLHVIPIMNLCLPGLDPNDLRKCLCTFQLLSTLVSLVPLVDCSGALNMRTDLTDIEKELCSSTAQFEDFVLQYLDKVFLLIENSNQTPPGREYNSTDLELSTDEAVLEVGILSSFIPIMQQSSAEIYKQAFQKVFRFTTTNIFDSQVAARYSAALCRISCQESPMTALPKYMPHLCRCIVDQYKGVDLSKEQKLDNELLWNLRILSEIVRLNGAALLPYKSELLDVLDMTLHLRSQEGATLSASLLQHLLRSLTLIYALDYKSSTKDWNQPLDQHLPLRDWGCHGDLKNINMKWHIPNDDEIDFATTLLERYLLTELNAIENHANGTATMAREDLTLSLSVIAKCISGTGSVLPMWNDSPVEQVYESMVDPCTFRYVNTVRKEEITLDGKNVRQLIVEKIRPLTEHMLSTSEDDTKSLLNLIKIYEAVMLMYGVKRENFDSRLKSLHIIKKSMQNRFLGKKKHIRAVLVDRIQMQHEHRLIYGAKLLTKRHTLLIEDLYSLATSQYSKVREHAQTVLTRCQQVYIHSNKLIENQLSQHLCDPNTKHHQLKGALYVLSSDTFMMTVWFRRDWESSLKLSPAFLKAHYSEKPSIIKLVDHVLHKIYKNLSHNNISIEVPDSCIESAKRLYQPLDEEQLLQGVEYAKQTHQNNLTLYFKLIEELTDLLESNRLPWKFYDLAIWIVGYFTRADVMLPARTVKVLVNGLVHESLTVRKRCITGLTLIMKQQKRKHKKVKVDPYQLTGQPTPTDMNQSHCVHGDRPDNSFLQYREDAVPTSQETWDKTVFVEKSYYGFYCWPRELFVYAPYKDQPPLGRMRSELTAEEAVIYDCFIDQQYIEKLFQLFTLEANRGNESFNTARYTMFRGLFRNYDDAFLHHFIPQLEYLIKDTKPETHESSHCFAAEIVASIICGSKHWNYEKWSAMWKVMVPLISTSLSTMSIESIANWGMCYATACEDRDPRRLGPLLEVLMDEPLRGSNGSSFSDMSRLYVLQGALTQQEWRVGKLLHRLKDYLAPLLKHSFKTVRDRLGSVLVNLFLYDLPLPDHWKTDSPQRAEFLVATFDQLKYLMPKTNNVKDVEMESPESQDIDRNVEAMDADDIELSIVPADGSDNQGSNNHVSKGKDEEREVAIRTLKTVMKWLQGSYSRMHKSSIPEVYKILPILCVLESDQTDNDLTLECSITLACIAHSLLPDDCVQPLLDSVQQVVQLSSWHARATILKLLQVAVFGNLFMLNKTDIVKLIHDIVLTRLLDCQIEVRELAAVTLSGLIHYGYLKADSDMIKIFDQLSSVPIKSSKNKRQPSVKYNEQFKDEHTTSDPLIIRHAGVLGYSACIQAYPYDVPAYIPEIIMSISNHLEDPQPIQMSVKKTLSNFRRTHYDNWQDHSQKFTEDQLAVMTDLLVSPNYYA